MDLQRPAGEIRRIDCRSLFTPLPNVPSREESVLLYIVTGKPVLKRVVPEIAPTRPSGGWTGKIDRMAAHRYNSPRSCASCRMKIWTGCSRILNGLICSPKFGPFIDRLAEGITDAGSPTAFPAYRKIHFKSVVVRIRNRFLRSDGSEIWTQRPAGSVDDFADLSGEDAVLCEWTAGWTAGRHLAWIAQTQAKSRVPGVGFLDDHQVMPLVSCVANVSSVPAAS